MTIALYDLVGADEARPFSPHCWKIAFALAHKELEFKSMPVRFTEIGKIESGAFKTVPAIRDGERLCVDSFQIALYLEETYPDLPPLFAGEGSKALSRFIEKWAQATLTGYIGPSLVLDVHDALGPADQEYFRGSREKRFGRTLEETARGREERLEGFRASLLPLRLMLSEQQFIGGQRPLFADYIVAGIFQWARVISPFPLLAAEDPVAAWFERCLDLHGGIGRRVPAAC
ncbi:glutathione S-transferase family protein [Nitratireductor kimnyeongensis]|uniref:Glutathione S-transferase family protein n=1 Tax=Nitratireductor kimnyeongensis TaxID=430679 RepID=A0ABW0T5C8_9HYPH|nr:glutathione S-transferase family protein [Nitratireductor kimnyeongensis]QZZ35129.1 glutathione S-transferase family protein [Nitratireductor kimnyeongensis]